MPGWLEEYSNSFPNLVKEIESSHPLVSARDWVQNPLQKPKSKDMQVSYIK